MTDPFHRAFDAVSKHSPKPDGSTVTFGLVAASLFGVASILVASFYSIRLDAHLVPLGLGMLAAFTFGVLFRNRRRRRHVHALAHELSKLAMSDLAPVREQTSAPSKLDRGSRAATIDKLA